MIWTQILYGWGGLNEALFHLINGATPQILAPLVQFFTFTGSYWTAPAVMVGLWLSAKRTDDARRANAISNALLLFAIAFAVALASASLLKFTLAFPRPSVVFGDAIRLIGEAGPACAFWTSISMARLIRSASLPGERSIGLMPPLGSRP